MISLIWKYYSDPVTVVPSRWIAPVERLVAFPTGVAGTAVTLFFACENTLVMNASITSELCNIDKIYFFCSKI